MKGRALIQYIIDTSDVVSAKKQEASEYLAKLEKAAQQSVQRVGGTHSIFFNPNIGDTPDPFEQDDTANR